MAERGGAAIDWMAEAQGDKTVVAQHPDGHRVVFGFSANARNEIVIHSTQWAIDGDYDENFLIAHGL